MSISRSFTVLENIGPVKGSFSRTIIPHVTSWCAPYIEPFYVDRLPLRLVWPYDDLCFNLLVPCVDLFGDDKIVFDLKNQDMAFAERGTLTKYKNSPATARQYYAT